MKNLFSILFVTFALNSCCKNDDAPQPIAEIDKLPPATQTGANTFGCLLDGKAFLPDNFPNATNCFYQLVNGEYYFYLSFGNHVENEILVSIDLGTNALEISEGNTYALNGNIPFNAYATYALNGIFTTTDGSSYTGELHITKLDSVNHIVSGTFWFDILDFQGNVHQIREGRFDMQYTN